MNVNLQTNIIRPMYAVKWTTDHRCLHRGYIWSPFVLFLTQGRNPPPLCLVSWKQEVPLYKWVPYARSIKYKPVVAYNHNRLRICPPIHWFFYLPIDIDHVNEVVKQNKVNQISQLNILLKTKIYIPLSIVSQTVAFPAHGIWHRNYLACLI